MARKRVVCRFDTGVGPSDSALKAQGQLGHAVHPAFAAANSFRRLRPTHEIGVKIKLDQSEPKWHNSEKHKVPILKLPPNTVVFTEVF